MLRRLVAVAHDRVHLAAHIKPTGGIYRPVKAHPELVSMQNVKVRSSAKRLPIAHDLHAESFGVEQGFQRNQRLAVWSDYRAKLRAPCPHMPPQAFLVVALVENEARFRERVPDYLKHPFAHFDFCPERDSKAGVFFEERNVVHVAQVAVENDAIHIGLFPVAQGERQGFFIVERDMDIGEQQGTLEFDINDFPRIGFIDWFRQNFKAI